MALFTRKKTSLPRTGEALPGRAQPLAVPDEHFVLGSSIKPPFPEGAERALFGMGCFWGAEKVFWQATGIHTTTMQDCAKPTCAAQDHTIKTGHTADGLYNSFYTCDANGVPFTE